MLAPLTAVVGGHLMILRALIGGSGPLSIALQVLALALLVLSAAAYGTTLVRSDAAALKVLVGLASGLLTLSVVEAFSPGDARFFDAVWGAAALMLGVPPLLRHLGREDVRPRAGSHAR